MLTNSLNATDCPYYKIFEYFRMNSMPPNNFHTTEYFSCYRILIMVPNHFHTLKIPTIFPNTDHTTEVLPMQPNIFHATKYIFSSEYIHSTKYFRPNNFHISEYRIISTLLSILPNTVHANVFFQYFEYYRMLTM